jgi:putative redox protein
MTARAHVVGEVGYANVIKAGHHELRADEPVALKGTDTGPSPYSLLLSALGACTSITLRMYAERKGWELGRIDVKLTHKKDGDADRIERELSFAAPLSDEQRAKLLEISEKTPVTKTIKAGAVIETRVAPAQ